MYPNTVTGNLDPRDRPLLQQVLNSAEILKDHKTAEDMRRWLAVPSKRVEASTTRHRYFLSPNPCRRGHVALRYTSTGNCIDCMRHLNARFARIHLHDSMPYQRIRDGGPVFALIKSLALLVEESDGRNGRGLASRIVRVQKRHRTTHPWNLKFLEALRLAALAKLDQIQHDLDLAADLAHQGLDEMEAYLAATAHLPTITLEQDLAERAAASPWTPTLITRSET